MAATNRKPLADGVVLYDIPSKSPCRAWSPNTWKARLVLNYKQIPYTTCWLEYPDIKPTLTAAGVPPNPASISPWPYTAPAAYLWTGEYLMDSTAIVQKLDSLHPVPAINLTSPYVARVTSLFEEMLTATNVLYVVGVPEMLLNPSSETYFREDRRKMLGMDIETYATERRRQQAFDDAAPFSQNLADMLRENSEGPFLIGQQVGYADFIIVAWMIFWDRLGSLDRIIMTDPAPLKELYAACTPWMQRDSD